MTGASERRLATRDRRRALGVCDECTGPLDVPGRVRCTACERPVVDGPLRRVCRCGVVTVHEWRDAGGRSVCWACSVPSSTRDERELMLG